MILYGFFMILYGFFMILYDVIFSSVLAMLGMVWGIDAAASMNMITNKIYFLHAHDVDLKYVLKFLGYFCHRIFEPYGVKSEFNFLSCLLMIFSILCIYSYEFHLRNKERLI